MLRGSVPRDRNPKEIMYDSLAEEDDMWTHLACAMGPSEVVYWGGKREVDYGKNKVVWVKDMGSYCPSLPTDIIFNRGGFAEPVRFLKKASGFKIYYGSGKRYIPEDGIRYDLVLADNERQRKKLASLGYNAHLWIKPAAPQFVVGNKPKDIYILYVADGRFKFRAKIKGVKWVYKNAPEAPIVHMGWCGKLKPPPHIAVKRVRRNKMPEYYQRARVTVVPYTSYDSMPRVIAESLACGTPVVALDTVNFWTDKYLGRPQCGCVVNKEGFWKEAVFRAKRPVAPETVSNYYKEHLSLEKAVEHLWKLIK